MLIKYFGTRFEVNVPVNWSRTKFEAIIVKLLVFYAKILPDRLDFWNDFYALDFFALCDLNFSHSQVPAAELEWRQFTTKIRMKSVKIALKFLVWYF